MKTMSFTTLEECIECYGRENLVAIDNLKQVIFFCTHGCQPKFVFENEEKVQFNKAIFNLSEEDKVCLENELSEVVGTINLFDFRNPQLMKEREEKTRLVYAKYGIKYVAA